MERKSFEQRSQMHRKQIRAVATSHSYYVENKPIVWHNNLEINEEKYWFKKKREYQFKIQLDFFFLSKL